MTKKEFKRKTKWVQDKYPEFIFEEVFVSCDTNTIHQVFLPTNGWKPKSSDFGWFNEIGLHLSYHHFFADLSL